MKQVFEKVGISKTRLLLRLYPDYEVQSVETVHQCENCLFSFNI